MKRRDSIKSLLVGTVAGVSIATGCKPDGTLQEEVVANKGYGRTPSELAYDEKVKAEIFLNDHELSTIAVLCDIILPATDTAGSATDAKVPDFIDFIVKDLPSHQIPMRGGLMWLDGESNARYNKRFVECSDPEQISIIDDIAYPDPEDLKPTMGPGRSFFSRMRNLTLTGYYTTKMGIDDLGYVGNRANLWDGVPQDELDKHGFTYEEKYKPLYVNHDTRNDVAQWDEDGNLIG